MSGKDTIEWLRDRILPTLVADSRGGDKLEPEWPTSVKPTVEALELAYQSLKDEMKSEDERIKTVESKLMSISSLTPIALTILVAMVTFLTSGKVESFTRPSIWVLAIFGGYVALQFLWAVRAAIKGLSRKGFYRLSLEDIFPRGNENREGYLQRTCKEMTVAIRNNRKGINQKVSQLAICHESIVNAVWGLLIMLLLLLAIVAIQPR